MDFYCHELYKGLQGRFEGTQGFFYSSIGRVYYVYAGAEHKPALLLLHNLGPGMSGFEWCSNFEELKRNFKVYAVDMPGCARSQKDRDYYTAPMFIRFVCEFITKKIKRPVIIIASGISAGFAVHAAHALPGYVRGVIVSAPVCSAGEYSFFSPEMQRLPMKTIMQLLIQEKNLKSFATGCVSQLAAQNKNGFFDEMKLCAGLSPDGETAAASMAKGLGNTDFYQILRYIKCPVLLLNANVHKAIGKNILTKNLGGKAPHFDAAGKFHDAVDDFAALAI